MFPCHLRRPHGEGLTGFTGFDSQQPTSSQACGQNRQICRRTIVFSIHQLVREDRLEKPGMVEGVSDSLPRHVAKWQDFN